MAAHDPAQQYPARKGQTEGPGSNGGNANNMLDDEDLFQALKNRKTEGQSGKVLKRPSAAPGTDGALHAKLALRLTAHMSHSLNS